MAALQRLNDAGTAVHQPSRTDGEYLQLISFPVAPELYRGHGSAVSLPRLIVGTRHCRVLTVGNINSDATGFDIIQQLPQPAPYKTLITIDRQLYFGKREASASTFEECQQAYQQIKD